MTTFAFRFFHAGKNFLYNHNFQKGAKTEFIHRQKIHVQAKYTAIQQNRMFL